VKGVGSMRRQTLCGGSDVRGGGGGGDEEETEFVPAAVDERKEVVVPLREGRNGDTTEDVGRII
jgi:hypothetical protein